MRAVIWLMLLAVTAAVAAAVFGQNDGLVSFYWGGWRLDVSLNLFVAGFLLSCFALFTVMQAFSSLLGLPGRARQWRTLQRERAAQAALREALAEFFGARYTRAHKAAQRALTIQNDTPELDTQHELRVLSHLLAAGSLHRLQDRPRRDEELRRVFHVARRPSMSRVADDGVRLLAAEWALDDRDDQRALQLLDELPAGVARRTQALRLRLQAYRQARRPLEALRTAHLLAKHQAFSPVAAKGLLRTLAYEALESAHDFDQLKRVWLLLEPADRKDPIVASRAAVRAGVLGSAADARLWLRPFWENMPALAPEEREHVALALVQTVSGIEAQWLTWLEAAMVVHAHEPAVLVAVGAAFAERKLWGKARRPLETAAAAPALNGRARRYAWRLLAQLARDESDEARATECEQAAARID